MDLELGGARVLVTGGASNIGRGIVHGFAAEGARVLICDIDAEQAAKTRAEALERGAAGAEVAVIDLTAEGAGATAGPSHGARRARAGGGWCTSFCSVPSSPPGPPPTQCGRSPTDPSCSSP